ncbi:hypothetical protein PTTG_12347, partial [Puccinia triticina 1-1 BBBD Race 1]
MPILDNIPLRRCYLIYPILTRVLTIVSAAYHRPMPSELVSVDGVWKTIDDPLLLDGVAHSDFDAAFNAAEHTAWSPYSPSPHYPANPESDGMQYIHTHEMPMSPSTFFQGPSTSSYPMMNQGHFPYETPIAPPNTETVQGASTHHPAPWSTTQDIIYNDILNSPNKPSELDVAANNALIALLLKTTFGKFQEKSQGAQITPQMTISQRNRHMTLPMVLDASIDFSKKLLRVADSTSSARQTIPLDDCDLAYKNLMAWMYDLHMRILDRANLPAYAYRLQHDNLFNWLENQVFNPQNGLPVMGRIDYIPGFFDWKDHHFGPTQLQLINYFAQPCRSNTLVSTTASSLVRKFLYENPNGYLASKYDPETSIREPINPEFMVINSFLVGHKLPDYSLNDELNFLIEQHFKKMWNPLTTNTMTPKTYHPKLPVA